MNAAKASNIYTECALRILELEDQVDYLSSQIRYTPYHDLQPIIDSIKLKKLESHRIRASQQDIYFKIRDIGGMMI